MTKVLCLEPVGGIAGDMFLALLIDLGVPLDDLRRGLAPLGLGGWRFEVSRASRHAIEGTHLDVVLDEPEHEHEHHHDHEHGHHHHRAWADIRAMIEASGLAAPVRDRALDIFTRLAQAEAKVHGTSVDEVSFHEVGAVDSIVDIVGAAVGLELLGVPEVYCAPPPVGSGTVRSAHGVIPVPAPATVELLRGRRVLFEGTGELTTPTGAALVASLTREGPFPELVLEKAGYGLGTRDFADRPNVLRGLLGERAAGESSVFVLEANLDDATPELIAWTLERLIAEGALDVWVAPVTMKKGRPGQLLGVLATGDKREALTALLLRETTTLGVRAHPVERTVTERSFETVETPYGSVRIKRASFGGATVNLAPEYEDCARLARERGVPLKRVVAAALAAVGQKRA